MSLEGSVQDMLEAQILGAPIQGSDGNADKCHPLDTQETGHEAVDTVITPEFTDEEDLSDTPTRGAG